MAKAQQTEAVSAVHPPRVPFEDAKPKILIVDDRRENLLATEKVLRPLSMSIFKASSGNEALSLILRHSFAVILLDVQMPEMDGFETAMLMQEHESMNGVPIIFVTAISKEDEYATRAAEIGAVDYIFKPINPAILKSKVKVYIDLYVQREEILKLNRVLQQSNEELERFAYICSHDMQEPVRMMHGYAEVLSESCEANLNKQDHRCLEIITSNARRMQKMIGDIIEFSRVGREEIKLEIVDCNKLAREVLAGFDGTIVEKSACVICGDLPVLKTNPTLIRALFENLLSNALKFQDGSKPPQIEIQAEWLETSWRFSVRDNGIGIDPAFGDKIFSIFRRIHRKEDYPGTGIGLSTCRKFIRLCGGDIEFASAPGEGAVFFFTIPQ